MSPAKLVAQATADSSFGEIAIESQNEVIELLYSMARIDSATTKSRAIAAEAERLEGLVSGVSAKSVERKYYAWRSNSRDWRALVNRAKEPDREAGSLPETFLQHWQGLCMLNQRKCKPAYRKLIRSWIAGEAIPGYDRRPTADPCTGKPAGWSYANLMRVANAPTKHELTAARIGRAKAAAYRPKVLTTRVGLQVGQYYMIDDMWHDFRVHVPGQAKPRRLLSLHAHDLFSANLFCQGHKPTMWNEDEAANEQLRDRETVFLLAYVFSAYGYNPAVGTVIIAEHGTAKVGDGLEKRLYDLSGGLITVDRSGIEGSPVCAGMFAGRSKGNSRFKAALESVQSLVHNETADMLQFPGQTGSNSRINLPEESHGRERYHGQLIKAAQRLKAEEAAKLSLPFLPLEEAKAALAAVYDLINTRDEHQLEGWVKAGLVSPEWRLDPSMPWQPRQALLSMGDVQRAAIDALLSSDRRLTQVRKLQPEEVWQQGRATLARLPDHLMPLIFGPDLAREVIVKSDHTISFEDSAIDPEPMVFLPELRGATERLLRAGEKFLAYLNPLDPLRLHLCDSKFRWLGHVERLQRICRADTEALKRASGRAARIEGQLLQGVIKGQSALIQRQTAARRNNAAILKPDTSRRPKGSDVAATLAAAHTHAPANDGRAGGIHFD